MELTLHLTMVLSLTSGQFMDITCADGVILKATLFAPQVPSRGVVVLAGATGVLSKFYAPFAEHLAAQGWQVLTWDARGVGNSATRHPRDDPARMRDWGCLDLDAALRCAASLWGSWDGVVLIGHSSGGHLAGLAPSLARVQRILLVASGTCHWRLYPYGQWPRLWAAWYLAAPALLALYGYLPAWAGVGTALPPGVVQDWRNWSVTPDYLFSDASLDVRGYANYHGQVHAISMADDYGFSPPATVRDLLRRFSSAKVSQEELTPAPGDKPIGHFGFFTAHNFRWWGVASQWLDSAVARA